MQRSQHAIAYEQFGPPSVLKLVEVSVPKRSPGDVLVKVHAAGVNPIDWKVRPSIYFTLLRCRGAPKVWQDGRYVPGHHSK